MGISTPFLSGTKLFSSISPDYRVALHEEMWVCFKFIGIPFDTLYEMPVSERRYYIMKYNEYMKEKEEATSQ